jgi:hypothetical protein
MWSLSSVEVFQLKDYKYFLPPMHAVSLIHLVLLDLITAQYLTEPIPINISIHNIRYCNLQVIFQGEKQV